MGKEEKSAAGIAETFTTVVGRQVDDERIPLARAALIIARTEYPSLDIEHYLRRLDEMAERVRRLQGDLPDASETIAALNQVLFAEEGLRGNRDGYYDPRNSFVNDVLERRLGIPITLSLIYMEVGQRVGFPLFGVGMPGHFLLKHYDVDGRETLIDPFAEGRILSLADCQHRLDEIYSGQMLLQPEFLLAVSRRQILTRVLNNLKNIYLSTRNFKKALAIVDLILAIYPRSPADMKQRATLRYGLGQLRAAAEDLEEYLKMSPEASDADEVRQTALGIRRKLAQMN